MPRAHSDQHVVERASATSSRSADMAAKVRRFRAADVEPARWLIYRAYAQVLLDLYGAEAAGQYQVRARQFMAMYLDRDPRGSFVAEAADGSLAGAVFCFVWGEVGWFGSLA